MIWTILSLPLIAIGAHRVYNWLRIKWQETATDYWSVIKRKADMGSRNIIENENLPQQTRQARSQPGDVGKLIEQHERTVGGGVVNGRMVPNAANMVGERRPQTKQLKSLADNKAQFEQPAQQGNGFECPNCKSELFDEGTPEIMTGSPDMEGRQKQTVVCRTPGCGHTDYRYL